jgi:predicted ATP-dependent serine protease
MHLTKDGKLKGSTLVPHAVDVNVQIMMDDEGDAQDRVISFYKNRFGATLDYNATMTSRGFQLSGKREVTRAPSKKARKRDIEGKILAIKEPPHITKERIVKELKLTSSQAYFALKELTDAGKLVKLGRGKDARWKHAL